MDRIINWLLLIIIFVFDPLAIALVVAANFAFAQLIPKTKENIYGEKVIISDDDEGSDIYTEDELKDWDSTLSDGLEDEEWDEDHALDQVLNDIVDDDWEIKDDEKEIIRPPRVFTLEEQLEDAIRAKRSTYTIRKLQNQIRRLNKNKKDDDLTIDY